MPRLLTVLVPLLAIVLAVAACGDNGDKDGDDGKPSPTADSSPTAEATAGTATPAAAETPALEPVPLRPATRIPPLDPGQRAEDIVEKRCAFDAATGLVNCGETGLYAPDLPVPADEVERCDILLMDDEPIAVACALPVTTLYFELPQ